jgi:phenylacetate-CoA ligase
MLTLGGASLNSRQGNAIAPRIYNLLRNNRAISVGQLDETDLNKIASQLNSVCPSLLYGYPSVLYLLARHLLHHKIAVDSIDRVITTSEMLFHGQRKLIEQAFHAPVYDEYGCPEAGLIAGECHQHQGLHYAMEICLLEVLDDTNTRVPIGNVGRLVATNLFNRAMCLIRYDTGDVGAVSDEPCECRRGLLQIKNLGGRTRDLIYTPDKKFVHGVAINHLMYNYPWVDRYQIVQETSRDLKLNLGVSGAVAPAYIEQLRSQLAEYTNMTVTVIINEPFIETSGKKNRLIISKIPIPDETQ